MNKLQAILHWAKLNGAKIDGAPNPEPSRDLGWVIFFDSKGHPFHRTDIFKTLHKGDIFTLEYRFEEKRTIDDAVIDAR